jgi:peptidoglycan/LPS O-acetylase OafA/YrhL
MIIPRIDAVTGLRGYAALLVVYSHFSHDFHLQNHNSGQYGVMIFFSLSGFLMSYLYFGKEFTTRAVADYVIARFARIAPAYLFVIVASYLIYSTGLDPGFAFRIDHTIVLRHLLFLGNSAVFWTIPPEVQFYAVFIVIWLAVDRFRKRADIGYLLVPAFPLFACMLIREHVSNIFVVAYLHFFLFGVIAGALRRLSAITEVDSPAINILQGALIAALSYVAFIGIPGSQSMSDQECYANIAFALLSSFTVFVFSLPTTFARFFLENKLATRCGEYSFSLYLLHGPVLNYSERLLGPDCSLVVFVPVALTAAMLVSWASFTCIERPGSRLIKSVGYGSLRRVFPRVFPA